MSFMYREFHGRFTKHIQQVITNNYSEWKLSDDDTFLSLRLGDSAATLNVAAKSKNTIIEVEGSTVTPFSVSCAFMGEKKVPQDSKLPDFMWWTKISQQGGSFYPEAGISTSNFLIKITKPNEHKCNQVVEAMVKDGNGYKLVYNLFAKDIQDVKNKTATHQFQVLKRVGNEHNIITLGLCANILDHMKPDFCVGHTLDVSGLRIDWKVFTTGQFYASWSIGED